MTSAQFIAWQAQHGLNNGQAAHELGLSPNSITKYRRENPPKVVALACAAITAGWDPIGKEDYDD